MAHDKVEVTVPGHVLTVDTNKENIVLAAGHGSIYILNQACELLNTIEIGHNIVGRSTVVVRNDLVIVGDDAGYISTCNLISGELQKQWRPEESSVTAIEIIEGIGVACGYVNGLIQIIDNDVGSVYQILKGHSGPITSLSYTASTNRLVSASEGDEEIRLWVPGSDHCHLSIKTLAQHVKRIESTDQFATASRECVYIRIWNILDGSSAAILSPPAHVRGTLTIEPYSLGGLKGILTCHRDGSIRVWDHGRGVQLYGFETGKKVRSIFPAMPVNVNEQTGEAVHRIVSGHNEGIVKIWRIPAPGSRPAHLDLNDDDDGLPCPNGEKILKPKKSDPDKWAFVSTLVVLDVTVGTAVGVARLKMSSTAKVDDDLRIKYQTVFNLYHINETDW